MGKTRTGLYTTRVKLSVLIPVYNERYLVGELVRRVLAVELPAGLERELVIVDDGSKDGTRTILEDLARKHPESIVYVPQPKNQGKGAAIRTAIARASGEFCIFQDADLEYDPADYPRVLAPLLEGKADVVYGSRFLPGERRRVLYFWHSLGNTFLTTLSNLFTDLNLSDMETCYKAFRTEVLKTIPIRSDCFGLEPEITAKVAKRGLRIYEVPIKYDGRTYAEGKKITWKDGFRALYTIVKYWLIDDVYDAHAAPRHLDGLDRAHHVVRWIGDELRPHLGHRVLELGAGIGAMSVTLLPRDRYIAADADERRLAVLRNLALRRPDIEIAKIDPQRAEDFEPYRGAVDTVLGVGVLEHLGDDAQALKNIADALAPGGKVLLILPQSPALFAPMDETQGRKRRYARADVAALLASAGLELERSRGLLRAAWPGWILNSVLMRRHRFWKIELKCFDALVGLWRVIDGWLPWPGLALLVVARKPGQPPAPVPETARQRHDAAAHSTAAGSPP